jgi:2-polyprenyl-6-methoxyphenol hydroxylase-like FAD-dependent oxidoreductase
MLLILLIVIFIIVSYVAKIYFKEEITGSGNNILIIGGGPIGLTMCYMLAASGVNNVTLVESRPLYKREQVIQIDRHVADVLDFITSSNYRNNLCNVDLPSSDFNGECIISDTFPNNLELKTITTKNFEKIFYDNLKQKFKNITLLYPVDNNKVEWEYRNGVFKIKTTNDSGPKDNFRNMDISSFEIKPEIVIAADGGNSQIAKIFGNLDDPNSFNVPIKNTVGCISFINEPIKEKKINNFKEETVCVQNRYRFFYSDERCYLGLQLGIGEKGQSKSEIEKLLKGGLQYYGLDPNKYTFEIGDEFTINPCRRKHCYQMEDNMCIIYVGDAFTRVNYFSGTGMNYGILKAVYLADLLNNHENIKYICEKYDKYYKPDCPDGILHESEVVMISDYQQNDIKIGEFKLLLPLHQQNRLNKCSSDIQNKIICTMPSFQKYLKDGSKPNCNMEKKHTIDMLLMQSEEFSNEIKKVLNKYVTNYPLITDPIEDSYRVLSDDSTLNADQIQEKLKKHFELDEIKEILHIRKKLKK